MATRLEHANLSVRDVDGMIRFLRIAFPDFQVHFYDAVGNDWEFVEYRSDDPREGNDYDLPDVR